MRASDVVNQLATVLPSLVDIFSDESAITFLTSSGTTATATTAAAHNLAVGQQAVVSGAQTPINVTSFTRVLTTGTIVTATDHDATKGLFATPTTVNVSEAFESEFNGDFPLLRALSRS